MRLREVLRPKNENGDINPVFIIVVLSVFIILVGIIWSVISEVKLANSNMTYIDNLSHYAHDMPDKSRQSIYRKLHYLIGANMVDGDRKIPNRGAKIRQDSYQEREAIDGIYISQFIVDISSVQQSYSVGLSWSKNGAIAQENYYVGISCVDADKNIYESFVCKKEDSTEQIFPGNDMAGSPASYLPYTKYDANGNPLYQITYYDGWIMVSLQTCGDEMLTAQYRAEVDAWLKNTKIDLEEYKDKTRYRVTCDGDF